MVQGSSFLGCHHLSNINDEDRSQVSLTQTKHILFEGLGPCAFITSSSVVPPTEVRENPSTITTHPDIKSWQFINQGL